MYLSKLPLFGSLPAAELTVLAQHTEERHFSRGHVLLAEGEPVPAIYALVDGVVSVSRRGRAFREFHAGDAVGVIGMLARTEEGVRAVAGSELTSLELGAEALDDIFEDHFSILSHVMRGTARLLRAELSALEGDAGFSKSPTHTLACPARELDLVERILVLQRSLPFAEASLTGLSELAHRATEVRLDQGEQLWATGEVATRALVLICGSVVTSGERSRQRVRFSAGDAVGIIDALAREPRSYQAVAEQPIVGLELDRGSLLDLFEDHFEMGVSCLAAVAHDVLAAFETSAAESDDLPSGLTPRPPSRKRDTLLGYPSAS